MKTFEANTSLVVKVVDDTEETDSARPIFLHLQGLLTRIDHPSGSRSPRAIGTYRSVRVIQPHQWASDVWRHRSHHAPSLWPTSVAPPWSRAKPSSIRDQKGDAREEHARGFSTALARGHGDIPENWRPELRRGCVRRHHADGGPGKAGLDPKGTVSRGAGARQYLARAWRGPAGDLFRLHARRVVGRCTRRALFHPARVLYPAGLDPESITTMARCRACVICSMD